MNRMGCLGEAQVFHRLVEHIVRCELTELFRLFHKGFHIHLIIHFLGESGKAHAHLDQLIGSAHAQNRRPVRGQFTAAHPSAEGIHHWPDQRRA